MLLNPIGLSLKGKSVTLHLNAGMMISKEIYIKRNNMRTKGSVEYENQWNTDELLYTLSKTMLFTCS